MENKWNFNKIEKKYNRSFNLNKKSIYEYLLTFNNDVKINQYSLDDICKLINMGYDPKYFSNLLFEISKQYINKTIVGNNKYINLKFDDLINYSTDYFYSYDNKILYKELMNNIINNYVSINVDSINRGFLGQMIPVTLSEKYIYLYKSNTIEDLFTLIHEFRHLTDYNLFYKLKELNPLVTEMYARDYFSDKFDVEESNQLFQRGLINISKKYYFAHRIYYETRYMLDYDIKLYLNKVMKIYKLNINELYILLRDVNQYKDNLYSYLIANSLHNIYDQNEIECVINNIDDYDKVLIKHY